MLAEDGPAVADGPAATDVKLAERVVADVSSAADRERTGTLRRPDVSRIDADGTELFTHPGVQSG